MTFTSPKTGKPVLARLPNSPHSCRPARTAAVLGDLGGGDLRPDGALARPRRGLLRRLRGGAERVRRRRAEVCRQRGRVLREDARRAPLSQLRDRAAADRPQQARAQAERSRRSTPAWSRSATTASSSRAPSRSRPAACCSDWIHLSCIHPLQPGDENYANCVAIPINAPGVKLIPRRPFALARRQFLRLSAVEPVRRIRQLRRVRQRVRAVGARVHLSQPGTHAATSGSRRPRIPTATIRRRCATSPSCAS